jgi:membrane protein DedA with SNARE-associated domain/membrane-associated phospholipid phosphatase
VIAGITEWILSLNGALALAIVFLVPALEASAFLGFLFPGEIAVILGGVLAFYGRAPLPAVIVAAVAGAIIGDSIGYFVGRRWGHQLLRGMGRHVPFLGRRIDEHLESARAYLRRRGGAAVFFGRFAAALRVMIPGLAGMAEIPYGEFALFNIAGGVIWGTGFVLLGYFAGATWHRVAADASKVGLGLLVLVLSGLVLTRLLRSIREDGERLTDRLARLRGILGLRRRFPSQSTWLARRVDPSSSNGFILSFVVVAGAICAWVFIGLTQDVVAKEEATLSDPKVANFMAAHRVEWITAAMKGLTWLGSSALLVPLIVAIGGYFYLRQRDWRPAAYVAAALVGSNVLYQVTKLLVARPRPPASLHLISISGFAFPSGHATAVLACWGMSALLLVAGRSARVKIVIWTGTGLIALLVGLSRLYLGVHWWTDVAGGFALGGLWLCILGVVFFVAAADLLLKSRPGHHASPSRNPITSPARTSRTDDRL